MHTLRQLKSEAEDANGRMEKMAVILTAVLKKVKGLEEAETLRAEKEMNFRKGLKESKGNEPSKLMAENQHLKELKTNEDKERKYVSYISKAEQIYIGDYFFKRLKS